MAIEMNVNETNSAQNNYLQIEENGGLVEEKCNASSGTLQSVTEIIL